MPERFRLVVYMAFVAASVLFMPTVAAADDELLEGAWHYRSIPCVETIVRGVFPRISVNSQKVFTRNDFEQSGVVVIFNSSLGTDSAFQHLVASVTHYQGMEGNDVMISERPGDRVQLCFIGVPLPTAKCNPDKDSRGRSYRVYDYRQQAQYSGENAEHTCGGA